MGASGAGPARFLVDHMLIKLGRYLRIVGLDADYRAGVSTHELILRANDEERVFLTRNTRLDDQVPRPERVLVLGGNDPVEQLFGLVMTQVRPYDHLNLRQDYQTVVTAAIDD